MPMEVTVHSEKLMQQLDEALERLQAMKQEKLPDVFLDWQREDMNRKNPRIDEHVAHPLMNTVTTYVYPRSNRPRQRRESRGRSTGRKRERRVLGVKRPILRPFLVTMLFDRMVRTVKESFEWR
jgi:hypothetical protein